MNNKLKIFLIIFFVILLAAVSYLLYIFKFKEYDVADEEVTEIIADPYEIELPDGSKLVIGEDGTVSTLDGDTSEEEGKPSSTDLEGSDQATSDNNSTAGVTPPKKDSEGSSTDQNKQPAISTGNNGAENTGKKVTVADVKGKYEPVFRQLEGQADQKINSLIGRAKKEFSDKKENGESISYGYFYNKYMGAANNLEASTDAAFYGVIKAVEAELAANGYNKSYAQSFIDEYEATKKARRDGILKKAVGRN